MTYPRQVVRSLAVLVGAAALAGCNSLAGLDDYGPALSGGGSGEVGGGGAGGMPGAGGGGSGPGGSGPSYAEVVSLANPIAYWPLDEPADSPIAEDVVGDYDGQYPDTKIAWGEPSLVVGGAGGVSLEGDQNIGIEVPSFPTMPLTQTFTMEVWLKRSVGDFGRVFSKLSVDGRFDPIGGTQLVVERDSLIRLRAHDGPEVDAVGAPDGPGFSQVAHVVAIHEASEVRIYVNATLIAKDTLAFSLKDGTESLDLGLSFSGTLDEMAIYDRVMELEEIREHCVVGHAEDASCGEPTLEIDMP